MVTDKIFNDHFEIQLNDYATRHGKLTFIGLTCDFIGLTCDLIEKIPADEIIDVISTLRYQIALDESIISSSVRK